MKKRGHRHSSSTNHTNSTTILSVPGQDPSPNTSDDSGHNSTMPISQSLDNVNIAQGHRYVPDFVAVNPRKTAV